MMIRVSGVVSKGSFWKTFSFDLSRFVKEAIDFSSLAFVTTSKDFRPVLNSRVVVSTNLIRILVVLLVCLIRLESCASR